MKYEIKEKAKAAHRLLFVLQYDIDNLKDNAEKDNFDSLLEDSTELNHTLNKLIDTIVELEASILMYKALESRE